MSATGLAEGWLARTLTADAQVQAILGNPARVYSLQAPANNASFPLALFTYVSGIDSYGMGLGLLRMRSTLSYDLKVIGEGRSIAALDGLLDRIDTLLAIFASRGPVEVTGGVILDCYRQGPPRAIATPDSGREYRQLIATYIIEVQETG